MTTEDVNDQVRKAAALHQAGDLDGASRAYRRILKSHPNEVNSLHLLGLVEGQRGEVERGLASIKRALSLRDDFPDAHLNAGLLYARKGDLEPAEHHFRRVLAYRPASAPALANLGNILSRRGRAPEAIAHFQAALQADPNYVDGYIELARGLRAINDIPGMLAAAGAGLRLAPQHPTLWLIASEAYFARGQLREGWAAYRWRFQSPENRIEARNYPMPQWQGEDLAGRSLLVWGEQGIGDEIMYASMLPDLLSRAARVVVRCSARMAPLLRRSFPTADVRDRDDKDLAAVDLQCPAASCGEFLRTRFEDFPKTAYLSVDRRQRDVLRAKYQATAPGTLLVGISWRSAGIEHAANKTVNVLDWGPILQIPGLTFVNLQYGDCRTELAALAKGFGKAVIHDPGIDPLKNMDSYAAQVAAMDLVVSSSNTAVHVAGALGVPAICLLPVSLGRGRRWYWFAEQGTCPWYPSLQYVLQRTDGQWGDVIRDAGLAVLDFAAAHGAAGAPSRYLRSFFKAYTDAGRSADAAVLLDRLAREPDVTADELLMAGNVRKDAYDAPGAMALYERALAADPTSWNAYNNKGVLLAALNRFSEAIECYKLGLERNPKAAELHNNLGTSLRALGRAEEALEHYRQAMAERPDILSIAFNYAAALDEAGQIEAAMTAYENIFTRDPQHADAHHNRAQLLLSIGRYKEGWAETEWRLKRPASIMNYGIIPKKRWQGEDLAGKGVVIWSEQGIGDEIMVASMVADAAATAARVTFLCTERLVPLMRRSLPGVTVDERRFPLPASATGPGIDLQMSMGDLGLRFRPDEAHFPQRRGFLTADPARRAALRARYTGLKPGRPVIGISWSSPKNDEIGWLKGTRLIGWGPILTAIDATFVNIQYGDVGAEIAEVGSRFGVEVVQDKDVDPLKDMDGFAAQVAAMDLVISVSNSAVHVAGGLGVPCWVAVPEGRGRMWYWQRDRSDSPWYSSLRLVRPPRSGGWIELIARIGADLKQWAETEGWTA